MTGATNGTSRSSTRRRGHFVGCASSRRSSSVPSMCRSKSSVSVRRVLAERRPAGDEDEVEAAGRVCQRQAGVVRKVQLAVRLETGWTQLPESERGIAGRRVGRDQRAALGMTEQQPVVGEVHRTGAVEEQVVHDDLRRRLPPQIEAGRPHALRGRTPESADGCAERRPRRFGRRCRRRNPWAGSGGPLPGRYPPAGAQRCARRRPRTRRARGGRTRSRCRPGPAGIRPRR